MSRRSSQAVREQARTPLPFYIWLLAGVLLGLALAALAFTRGWVPALRDDRSPRPDAAAVPVAPTDSGIERLKDSVPVPAAETRPRFDFYSVLPEMETVIPQEQIQAEAQATPAPDVASGAATGTPLYLQAGSFRAAADAEQMKARLALVGVRAAVVPVNINGTDWFRVRAGPYPNARALSDARATLETNGINSIALRDAGR